ncbi:MAG: hypothetical protein IJU86_03790, partial [Firmicutes bacterium]|nr:hypothetical protein [Bacillota bacterium]
PDNPENNEEKIVFNMDNEKKQKVEEKVIKPFLSLLKKMTEKCINCESDCYPKDEDGNDVLSLLTEIMEWGKNYFSDKNVLQNIEQQYFNIMKDIMIHRKNLLLNAIKNHKIEDGFKKTNLQTTLREVLNSTVLFSGVFQTEEAHEFLRSFYANIFDELTNLLNKSYALKDQKINIEHKDVDLNKQTIRYQYEHELMGTLFYVISSNIYKTNPYASYVIGNLFIKKYYDDTKNQKYLYVPHLMLFIQNKFNDDIRTSDQEYFQKKLKLISGRIDILRNDAVKKTDPDCIKYYEKNKNGKYKYSYFGFTPDEFFGIKQEAETNKIVAINPDDETAEKFRLNMDYVVSIEDALTYAWRDCNKLFHQYRKEYLDDRDSQEKREKYEKIKKDRSDIYDMFRDLETEKQKLLKNRLTGLIKNNFPGLSKTEKILRSLFLILTFPIWAPIFILVKTLKKFFHCLRLGFEAVWKLYVGFRGYGTCKDVWAKDCELNLDGLKINDNEEIQARIKWYETKTCLLIRRILFPIDLVIHILIGIFVAIKKIFTSIIKVFTVVKQIYQDIWDDNTCSHMFKTQGIDENKSEVICNHKSNISVLPTGNIKVRNKFIDMTCPRVPYYDFSKKPKSIRDHIQCATGFKSIKSAGEGEYDKYAHEHSGTPRLKYD